MATTTTGVAVQSKYNYNVDAIEDFKINGDPEVNRKKLQEIFYKNLVAEHFNTGIMISFPFALLFPPLGFVVYGIYCATMKYLIAPRKVKEALIAKRAELIKAGDSEKLHNYVKKSKYRYDQLSLGQIKKFAEDYTSRKTYPELYKDQSDKCVWEEFKKILNEPVSMKQRAYKNEAPSYGDSEGVQSGAFKETNSGVPKVTELDGEYTAVYELQH